jgi:hypothetical protein
MFVINALKWKLSQNFSMEGCRILACVLLILVRLCWQARGNVVVKALSYKPEGRGFETNQSGELIFFSLPNPSGRTWPLILL